MRPPAAAKPPPATSRSAKTGFTPFSLPGAHGGAPAQQADGKVLAVSVEYGVFRINTDGSFDSGFADNDVTSATERGIALQSDQKIVTVGQGIGTRAYLEVHRLNADGTFDTSYDDDGVVLPAVTSFDSNGQSDCVQPDGKDSSTATRPGRDD